MARWQLVGTDMCRDSFGTVLSEFLSSNSLIDFFLVGL